MNHRRRKFFHLSTCILLLSVYTFPFFTAKAEVSGVKIFVDSSATSGSNNGITWEDAFLDLQDALAAASSGDSVRVARGIYTPTPGADRNATFQLINEVEILGGFPKGGGEMSTRDPWANVTILSGDIGVLGDDSDNSYHVVTGSGTDRTATLDGFQITGGNGGGSDGAGMLNITGSPTIRNVSFYRNTTNGFGGGMSNATSSHPSLENVVFQGNTAESGGGGLDIYSSSSAILANVVFSGNSADFGGGVNVDNSSSASITHGSFSANEADVQGGGFYISAGSIITVSNSILWDNNAPTGPEIYRDPGGTATYTYTLIEGSGGSGVLWDTGLGTDGGGNRDIDPLFMHAADPGPDGTWGTFDDDYGDLRLNTGSPAIDRGVNAIASSLDSDLPGNPRIIDIPASPNGPLGWADMGAYEMPPSPLYVDQNASGTGDGLSWEDAFTDLQNALKWGRSGLTDIWVAEGRYTPGGSQEDSFVVMDGVNLYGGFPQGGWHGMFHASDPWNYTTILSGDIGVEGDHSDNSRNVVVMLGIYNNTTLDGFTITGGNNPYTHGSGLKLWKGTNPTIRDCIFLRNASYNGGGLSITEADPHLENLIFQGNHADSNGGGVLIGENSDPTLVNLVFSGNTAADGGGVYASEDSEPSLTNLTFSQNQASNQGGGIYIAGDTSATLENSILWDNAASSGDQIYRVVTGTLKIYYSLIEGSGGSGPGWDTNLGVDGDGNLDEDPLFVQSPEAGDDAAWGTDDDDYGDLRLKTGSPAIDQGDDDAPGGVTTDLPGNPRFYDQPSVSNGPDGFIDFGAYEAPPTRLYVDYQALGSETGLSWVDALEDLQEALQLSRSGPTEIWVAEGAYQPGALRTDTFLLLSEVSLYGGFPTGGGDGSFVARDPWEHITILDGDLGADFQHYDNSYHIIIARDVNDTAVVDGFIIYAGNADDTSHAEGEMGGGILNIGGSPTIKNTTFLLNRATTGGGMMNESGDPTLENVLFLGNMAESYGGGMENEDASEPILINANFVGNTADHGGGLTSRGESSVRLAHVTLHMNEASTSGGGMLIEGASYAKIANTIFWGNTAPSGSQILKDGSSTADIAFSLIEGSGGSGTGWDTSLGTDGGGNLDANPSFVRIPDPGFDTSWGSFDDDFGDQRLLTGSPAIDQGSNKEASLTTTDLPGNPRLYDQPLVPDSPYGYADMGAYESPPTRLYVDGKAGGADTGLSWADAFTNLQSALKWSRSGPVDVWVAEGEYLPGETRSDAFQLHSRVAVYGGFPAGGGDGTFSARDWEVYPTILEGDIGSEGDPTDNTYHVLTCNNSDNTAILDGFTVTGGYANYATIHILTTRLKIYPNVGGGWFGIYCDATLSQVRFDQNYAQFRGGGLMNDPGSPELNDVEFTENQASKGGGLYARGDPVLQDVRFEGNSAITQGGGIYADYADYGRLIRVEFLRNTAGEDGGGMYSYHNGPDLIQVVFKGNTAGNYGGGIFNNDGNLTLVDALFSGNSAEYGGGILNSETSILSLINATFSGNLSLHGGTGLRVENSDVLVHNTVFWGNTGSGGSQVVIDTESSVVFDYSLIQGGCPSNATCTHLLSSDPQFVQAPDPGLDSTWGTSDDDYGDLHLTAGSPAIDAGDNSALPADAYDLDKDGNLTELLPYDLDGNSRRYDVSCIPDTGSGALPLVDLGAYEVQITTCLVYAPLVLR